MPHTDRQPATPLQPVDPSASGTSRHTGRPDALPLLCSPALLRLRRLMQAEGWTVDVQRMCLDTDYAYDRLATAHTSSDARLRATALALFEAYGRNSAPALH